MVTLTSEEERLLDAWLEWDRHPGGERQAKNRMRAIDEFAESISVDALELRRNLARWRREGFTHQEAILRSRGIDVD